MPRTIVYASKLEQARLAADGADDYRDKLVKYVPAEVLAFFLPVAALIATLDVPTDVSADEIERASRSAAGHRRISILI